jgi:hypothetical protein
MQPLPITLHSLVGVDASITNIELLRKFLCYYRTQGIQEIVLDLQTNRDDNARIQLFSHVAADYGAIVRTVIREPFSSHLLHTPVLNRFLAEYSDPNRWCVMADADEFIRFPNGADRFFESCTARGFNVIHGTFVDRLSTEPPFPPIDADHSLDSMFPFTYPLTRQIRGGWDRKVVAIKGRLTGVSGPLYEGRHALDERTGWGTAMREARMLKLTDAIRVRRVREGLRTAYYRFEPSLPGILSYPGRLEIHHFAWDSVLKDKVSARLETDSNNTHPREYLQVLEFVRSQNPYRLLKPYLLDRAALGV